MAINFDNVVLFLTTRWICNKCNRHISTMPNLDCHFDKGYECPSCGCTSCKSIGPGRPIGRKSPKFFFELDYLKDTQGCWDEQELLDNLVLKESQ